MKLTKFGKAFLIGALSAGVVLSVTSCVQSYTVGYLYVTGTVTAETSSAGIITGFKIDHNTGKLTAIHGLPISSGGANPDRAVLLTGGRYLYVLNRGVTASGGLDCTTTDPCQNSNITQFEVGGNGVLTPQETFYTQGVNPFRIIGDTSGNYIYVLDHDSPGSPANTKCAAALGNDSSGNPITACADVTAFQVNSSTGRLTLVVDNQATMTLGSTLPYFPVPANPVDFALVSGYLFTLSGTASTGYPYSGGSTVFPYAYNSSSGQLSISQNSSQPLNIAEGTAIVSGAGFVYLLDNEPITVNGTTSPSQILPFTTGSNGALQPQTGGAVPDDPTEANPIYLLVESKGKWVYVANQGTNANNTNAQSGIAGYVIDPSTHQLSFIAGEPFGTGAGPQCMIEDPSNQFIYTANYNDSSVTGRVIDQNAGVLDNLRVTTSYALTGPATWCLVTGRVS